MLLSFVRAASDEHPAIKEPHRGVTDARRLHRAGGDPGAGQPRVRGSRAGWQPSRRCHAGRHVQLGRVSRDAATRHEDGAVEQQGGRGTVVRPEHGPGGGPGPGARVEKLGGGMVGTAANLPSRKHRSVDSCVIDS